MADELKNPMRRSVIGEIISIKEINKDDFEEGKFRHDCRIVRVDPLNGAPLVDVYITNDQYDKYGLNAIIFAGNVVNFSIDENIANETGYIDPDTKEWTYHTKTFNSFAGADNVGSLGLIGVFGKLGVGADIVSGFIKNIVKLLLSLKRLKLLLLNKQKKLRKFREVVLSILSVLPLLFVT